MSYLEIGLICLCSILSLAFIVLWRKNSAKQKVLQQTYEFISAWHEQIVNANIKLDSIDKNGAFSSDDEVGFGFILIKTCMQDIQKLFSNILK